MSQLHDLLDRLWQDYATLNPQAQAIHDMLTQRGEKIVNDHIAFRTYDDPRINLEVLAALFTPFGYVVAFGRRVWGAKLSSGVVSRLRIRK